jgi:hypothetical protein
MPMDRISDSEPPKDLPWPLPRPPHGAARPGRRMPLVGLGTGALTGSPCYRAVRYALEVGYRHLDTATMYDNERGVGRAIRDSGLPRDQVFVTTKLPPEHAGRERPTLDDSLRALQMDDVDLWLVHWPPPRPGPGPDLEGAPGRPRRSGLSPPAATTSCPSPRSPPSSTFPSAWSASWSVPWPMSTWSWSTGRATLANRPHLALLERVRYALQTI